MGMRTASPRGSGGWSGAVLKTCRAEAVRVKRNQIMIRAVVSFAYFAFVIMILLRQ
jgi:hypothetical protein